MKEQARNKNEEKRLRELDRQEYREKKKRLTHFSYLVKLFFAVFTLTVAFSCLSGLALDNAGIAVSVIVIVIIAFIGVIFDIIGVSATGADLAPFNAMASRKIRGARRGAWLIRNADRVASMCNDVIGDMSGIISGSAGTALSARIAMGFSEPILKFVFPLAVTAIIATFVIVGKAAGKTFAIRHANETVFFVARFLTFFRREK